MTKILVVGHSDADGHVIAEQTRRNLSRTGIFDVSTFVDAKLTQGHRSWLTVEEIPSIDGFEVVVFVDLMFSPVSFAQETDSLCRFAASKPKTKVLVIDHHPIPFSRLQRCPNISAVYRSNVLDCTIGPRSDLMVLAALDENQRKNVEPYVQGHFSPIVKGLRRAAAKGGELQGSLLSTLIRHERWSELFALGNDDAEFHKLVRGMRPKKYPTSDLYRAIIKLAKQLANKELTSDNQLLTDSGETGVQMAFDVQNQSFIVDTTSDVRGRNEPKETRDLEAIVTVLELAAITLTDSPDSTFSQEELLACAREYAGESVSIREEDIDIVMEKTSFLHSSQGKLCLK